MALLGSRPLRWIEGLGFAFEVRLDRAPRAAKLAAVDSDMEADSDLGATSSEADSEVSKVLVGICFDDPEIIDSRPNWESVDYLAVNSAGEVIVMGGIVGLATRLPGADKGFNRFGYYNDPETDEHLGDGSDDEAQLLEVGDIIRVCITEAAKLVVSVNGVPTVSAPLSVAKCLCADCTTGLHSCVRPHMIPEAWGKGKGRSGGRRWHICRGGKGKSSRGLLDRSAYPMVGLPDPSAVTMLPVAAP